MADQEEHPPSDEAKPPDNPPEVNVFITADCGCRFQVVSGMPVMNAGVLHMPDVLENVCESHRVGQEEALEEAKKQAMSPQIVDPSGRTIVSKR